MSIQLRLVDLEKDYPLIASWWQGHEFPAPQQILLPPLGVMAENDGVPVAAAFLYEARECLVAFIEWTITDPMAPRGLSAKAVALAIDWLVLHAPERGYPILMSGVGDGSGLHRLLKKMGWSDAVGKPHRMMITVSEAEELAGGRN